MAKSKPGKPGYVYQGKENDRLFKATCLHVDGFGCSNCDTKGEIARDGSGDRFCCRYHRCLKRT
jgi:hypothetical protein